MTAYRAALVWIVRATVVGFVALGILSVVETASITWQSGLGVTPIMMVGGLALPLMNGVIALAVAECLALLLKRAS